MAASRSTADIRRELASEREQLAAAVGELRGEADVGGRLRSKLPALAGGALGAGFVLAGGIGATMRLLARRGREGTARARLGRYTIVDRG